jgi:flavin reductase (DIM6/NTAB) family NADH-FMN oxidoreductase RutF
VSAIDQRAFRDTVGRFCTGVVLVTGVDDGEPVGFAAQSFVSLSLDPPLVALCPAITSSSWPRIRGSGHFCINVLGADQKALCDAFARSGGDKYAGVSWSGAPSGSPRIDGVLAWIDCALEAEHEAGDHTIAIGRVAAFEACDGDLAPLLFYTGAYGRFTAL